jgi:hypothetical protein
MIWINSPASEEQTVQPVTPCQSGVATLEPELEAAILLACVGGLNFEPKPLCFAHFQRRLGGLRGLGRISDDGPQRAYRGGNDRAALPIRKRCPPCVFTNVSDRPKESPDTGERGA